MSFPGPVNHIDRATRVHYIVEKCTICGGTHRHGAVPDLKPGESTSRAPPLHRRRSPRVPSRHDRRDAGGTMTRRVRGLKSGRYVGEGQDAPLANQLKADPGENPRPLTTCSSLAESHSSFGASDRGGSFGRYVDDRMYATTHDDRSVRQTAGGIGEELSGIWVDQHPPGPDHPHPGPQNRNTTQGLSGVDQVDQGNYVSAIRETESESVRICSIDEGYVFTLVRLVRGGSHHRRPSKMWTTPTLVHPGPAADFSGEVTA